MRVEEILKDKQTACRSVSTPNEVTFTTEEIETLTNRVSLNVFRMSNAPDSSIKPCSTLNTCFQKIQEEDNLYRVLEFCAKKNRVCQSTIYSIFNFLGTEQEDLYE